MADKPKRVGRPSHADELFESAREILLTQGAMTVSQLAKELDVSVSTLKFYIYGQRKVFKDKIRRYGGQWADKVEIIKIGRDPVVALKVEVEPPKHKTVAIRMPAERHRRIKAIALAENKRVSEVVGKFFELSSASDRRLWYSWKLIYSYAQYCMACELGKTYEIDIDKYEQRLVKTVKQIEDRLGIDASELIENIPKLIRQGQGKYKAAGNDMVKLVVYAVLTTEQPT